MDTEPVAAPPPPLAVGQVIDGFRLEEALHQGGMAYLWRVTRVEGDNALPLIMKVPRIKGGEDPATIVGFEVEQMIMPTLSGVHVPCVIAKGDFSHQPYIVMERFLGDSLRPRLEAAPIAVDDVVSIGVKVATALHALHRQHVIHLDIKPSNIMFRATGEAVLIDFGLSRHDFLPDLLDEEFKLPLGTGPYMSPEQVQFTRNDPRSDLFALGVMLYHLLTGQRPFGSPTNVRGLRERLYREPVPPIALRPDCPPWLQEVVLRCLEVRPELRHASGAQLAQQLLNPEQVVLTERAARRERAGRIKTLKRWLTAVGTEPAARASATEQTARSPIVLAALDIAGAEPELLNAVRTAVQRLLHTEPGARLACLAVMKTHRIAMDDLVDADGQSKHVRLLVQLKSWARPLNQSLGVAAPHQSERITFHVIEAPDAANAIVEYAQRNQIDHIVMGARSSGTLRRYLGSVSAQVAAESNCSVTVVRCPGSGK